jgi:hypothetical protein
MKRSSTPNLPLVFGCLLLASVVCIFFLLQNRKPRSAEETAALKNAVALYMRGEAVRGDQFPWYDPLTRSVRPEILNTYLEMKVISKEQYYAFEKFQIYWKKSEK